MKQIKKFPKGNKLLRKIGDEYLKNEDSDLNIKVDYIPDSLKSLIIKEMSNGHMKALFQISSVLEYKGKKEMKMSARYLANGICPGKISEGKFLRKRARRLNGLKNKFGCDPRTIKRFCKDTDGLLINIKKTYKKRYDGTYWNDSNTISLTSLGEEILSILRKMFFEKALFPKFKKGMHIVKWTKIVSESRLSFKRKKIWFSDLLKKADGSFTSVVAAVEEWHSWFVGKSRKKVSREEWRKKSISMVLKSESINFLKKEIKRQNSTFSHLQTEYSKLKDENNRLIA